MPDPHDWLYSRTRSGTPRDPRRTRALLDQLGAPDLSFHSIRVTGTNGKGSTSAMLEAGLIAAGQATGRFTSPHLQRFEERIRVHGHEIPPSVTREFITWAREHVPHAPFFDLALALATRAFQQSGVTHAVMEAGVGGASDATHALHNVTAVLLTNVTLDHTSTLGPTIEDITRDKVGAALPGVPFLTTATGEALAIATNIAIHRAAPLYTPATHPTLFHLPRPPRLLGTHQHDNARLALATLRLLGFETGVNAALDATHPGRLERFDVHGREVWLDGAHNPAAANALAQAIPPIGTLLFGAFERKAVHDTLAPLLNLTDTRVFTRAGEGSVSPEELTRHYGGLSTTSAREALSLALNLTPPGGRILATGSLHLVGQLRTLIDRSPTNN